MHHNACCLMLQMHWAATRRTRQSGSERQAASRCFGLGLYIAHLRHGSLCRLSSAEKWQVEDTTANVKKSMSDHFNRNLAVVERKCECLD